MNKQLIEAYCRTSAREIVDLPVSLDQQIFWVLYKQWHRLDTGELSTYWASKEDHCNVQDLLALSDKLGVEFEEFCTLTLNDLKKKCQAMLQSKS